MLTSYRNFAVQRPFQIILSRTSVYGRQRMCSCLLLPSSPEFDFQMYISYMSFELPYSANHRARIPSLFRLWPQRCVFVNEVET